MVILNFAVETPNFAVETLNFAVVRVPLRNQLIRACSGARWNFPYCFVNMISTRARGPFDHAKVLAGIAQAPKAGIQHDSPLLGMYLVTKETCHASNIGLGFSGSVLRAPAKKQKDVLCVQTRDLCRQWN